MNAKRIFFGLAAVVAAFVIFSCASPVSMTSWKNPAVNAQISHVVVMPLFNKLEYVKPFEQAMDAYFNTQGLKAIGSLDFLNPTVKYTLDEIKQKCDSIGADAIVVFTYAGTDKTQNYVPPTTYVNGGFGGYWGGGYWGGPGFYDGPGYYGGPGFYDGPGYYGGNVVTTGGYWTTTSVVNLKASLYTKASKDAIWTADISVTDPNYVDQSATTIAQDIFANWQQDNLLKFAPAKK